MKPLSLLVLCAVAAVGQPAGVIVDNAQVRVVKVTVPSRQKTPPHDHKLNRVMIYLNAGRQELAFTDGRKTSLAWRAGDVKWSPAAGAHTAEVLSRDAATLVEVELKKDGPATAKPVGGLDPVKLDPKHYKVEFENPQVRVLRVKIGGKESVPLHEHARDRVVVYLTDLDFRVTGADGQASHATHQAGDVTFSGPAAHKEENLSSRPLELVVIELKG